MFKKFSSIENAYRQKYIDFCENLGVREWVALEKIHGTNFGFIVNEGEVTPFKRTSPIQKNEHGNYDFYGCNPIVEAYAPKAKNLASLFADEKVVIVYGELYGQGIQKEIDYGEKDFIAFDIHIPETDTWVEWDKVVEACDAVGIPTVPEYTRGTLEWLLGISPEIDSIVASKNGVAAIAEGFVIKPLTDRRLGNDSRPIIKNKSSKFQEKKDRTPKKPRKMDEELVPVFESVCSYLNEVRLSNVLSKEETVTQKDFGRLQGLLVKDALEDYTKDNGEIEKDAWKEIAKPVNGEAAKIIRSDWLNILDRFA